jgi:hypothetical protein
MRKKLEIINEANIQINDGPGRKRKHLHINFRKVEGIGDIHNRVKETLEKNGDKKKIEVGKTVKLKKKDKSK